MSSSLQVEDAGQSATAGPGFGRSRRFLSALSDARLVERVRRGNELAFEVLYDRYSGRILSFCRHMLGSREEAEDAVQHTFMAAYREMTEGDREINLKPWLFTIARNRSISIMRARHEQPAEELDPSTAGLSEQVEQRAELRELLRDLRDLPVDQRAALLLAELGDLSHADIASVVGCPTPKVKALVFQARSNLSQRRDARETPCREVRQDIATLRGRAVRRGVIRRHLSACPGCAAFWEETRSQRERLSLVLPVVPTLALKERALAATGLAGGSGGGGGIAGLVGGGLVSRPASVAVFAGGTLLAAGAAVTGIGVATDDPSSKPKPAAEARDRGGEARSAGGASERAVVTAERTAPAPELRAVARGKGRRGRGRKGSPPRGVVLEPAPGTLTGPAPEQVPASEGGGNAGGSGPSGTPRRTRTRRHGGGPSPNANPQAGPPKSPDHPTPPNGGNDGGGRGGGGGKGPKPR